MKMTMLHKVSVKAIKICMGAKRTESILVISDTNKREIGLALYETALHLGNPALYVEMKPLEFNGEEPPSQIAEAMKMFDIVFIPTTTSLTHTAARRNASAAGVRVATFPNINKEVMIRGLSADYKKIEKLSLRLQKILEKAKLVRVTSAAGTDITFSIEGRKAYASTGLFVKKGQSGNLPTGETFLAPVEGSANGTFVVDGSMAGIGLVKGKPLVFKVEDGYVTTITGNQQAKKLKLMLKKFGKPAFNIAEFGIGTNDTVKLSGLVLEDEKVLGTVHIALGNNLSMGGSVDVPLHLDGIIKKPDVYLDGVPLMKKGALIPRL